MNIAQTQSFAVRAVSLLASVAITAAVLGSQLIIANGYDQQAGAELAARTLKQPVAQQAASAPQRSS